MTDVAYSCGVVPGEGEIAESGQRKSEDNPEGGERPDLAHDVDIMNGFQLPVQNPKGEPEKEDAQKRYEFRRFQGAHRHSPAWSEPRSSIISLSSGRSPLCRWSIFFYAREIMAYRMREYTHSGIQTINGNGSGRRHWDVRIP